ncbi:MAG: deoxyribodipyrimidine photo-lyase [Halieaceae bacterium]|jgi:deoxyribodipyrimidine photo-lyase
MNNPIIFWHRQDLRLDDLPGLNAATATGRPIIPCYILDDEAAGEWRPGAASRWWLHHSLVSLTTELSQRGATLVLRRGDAIAVLERLLQETGAEDIYFTRMYEPWAADLERRVHQHFAAKGINVKRYGGALLHEPEAIANLSGKPYKVFTPFWRSCRARAEPALPQPQAATAVWWQETIISENLDDWQLCPRAPDWAAQWQHMWSPGATGAREKLQTFLLEGVNNYSEGRNHPALKCTARLSAHLHYGEISPREIWHQARYAAGSNPGTEGEVDKFLSEMGWREFSHHLLHHFPEIPEQAFKVPFRQFPWLADQEKLLAWQTGQTGYPMVDAGMRELWHTGFMHNRVRMIVASFLTKHLLIHWREGARWFWDTLLDADLANNSSGWQWVAGSGADASPYFRIFNPILQGEKFDAHGDYIREWVPELGKLPDRYLNCPWEAPTAALQQAGITLGGNYPHPIVDHKAARESALAALASLREHN